MVEEIIPNLYRIEVPLLGNPLKSLNSYLIKSSEKNLIIDTGLGRQECMNTMELGLKTLGVDLRKTDFFITHFHLDHIGLISKLKTDRSIIYFNQPDADSLDEISAGNFWEDMIHFIRLNGFPEGELKEVLNYHPAYPFRLEGSLPFRIVTEGDPIGIANYQFKCVKTPGHTKGHMCLYEPHKKILVSGDHILNDITPIIQLRSDEWNPLKEYLKSLDKIDELDIGLVLPGHRSIFANCKERIKMLKYHHKKRLEEVVNALEKGKENAYQVASQISWDISCESWDLFPVIQKWFAIGEVIADLKYLEENRIIEKEIGEQKILYSLKGGCQV